MRFMKDHRLMQLVVPRTRSTWLWAMLEGEFYDDISEYSNFVDDNKINLLELGKWPSHTPNWAVSKMFKKPRHSYKKFTVVRNPWERYASFYTRLVSPEKHNRLEHEMSSIVRNLNFSQFIEQIAFGNRTFDLCTQVSFLLNHKAALDIDYIFKFENYLKIKDFFIEMGYNVRSIPITAPNREWRAMYTRKDIQLVQSLCELDIRYFGYKFE